MKIGPVDLDKNVMIVAEVGNNHEGSYSLAEEMIGLAANAGANAVKFQTIVPERLVAPDQRERLQQLRKFQLSQSHFERLEQVARKENIIFLSTPFDVESVRFLNPHVPAFKIASGDNNFIPLIDEVARTGKPILLSSGLSTLDDMSRCCDYIMGIWKKINVSQDLAVLHCVVSYPTAPCDANLLAIKSLQKLDVTTGYSDHTMGIDASVLAVALGARIIEKHFTIRKDYSEYHDHKISADPEDMAQLVERVRLTLALLGDGEKRMCESELANMGKVRRSVVAARDLSAGTVLTWSDLDWLRPGGGISPGNEFEVLNKALVRPVSKGEMIRRADVRLTGKG